MNDKKKRERPPQLTIHLGEDPAVREAILSGLNAEYERFGLKSRSELIRKIGLGELEVVIPRRERHEALPEPQRTTITGRIRQERVRPPLSEDDN